MAGAGAAAELDVEGATVDGAGAAAGGAGASLGGAGTGAKGATRAGSSWGAWKKPLPGTRGVPLLPLIGGTLRARGNHSCRVVSHMNRSAM